jgi:hypothetical protein
LKIIASLCLACGMTLVGFAQSGALSPIMVETNANPLSRRASFEPSWHITHEQSLDLIRNLGMYREPNHTGPITHVQGQGQIIFVIRKADVPWSDIYVLVAKAFQNQAPPDRIVKVIELAMPPSAKSGSGLQGRAL